MEAGTSSSSIFDEAQARPAASARIPLQVRALSGSSFERYGSLPAGSHYQPTARARPMRDRERELATTFKFGCFWHALVVVLFGTRLVVVVVLQKQQLRSRDWYG